MLRAFNRDTRFILQGTRKLKIYFRAKLTEIKPCINTLGSD